MVAILPPVLKTHAAAAVLLPPQLLLLLLPRGDPGFPPYNASNPFLPPT